MYSFIKIKKNNIENYSVHVNANLMTQKVIKTFSLIMPHMLYKAQIDTWVYIGTKNNVVPKYANAWERRATCISKCFYE
jgi:hypothetical protein